MVDTLAIRNSMSLDISLFGEEVRNLVHRAGAVQGDMDEIARCVAEDMACSDPDPISIKLEQTEIQERAIVIYTSVTRSISISQQVMDIIRNMLLCN
jgi:tetrahydromethanopterin S-methyltransferase subunit A